MHDRVIVGGMVAVGDEWVDCDVAVSGGKISGIGHGLRARESIDASGQWVLPGGIDTHCHIDQPPWKGIGTADGFATATVSAAFGGTTTVVPFAMPGDGMDALDAIDRSLALAEGRSMVDYGLHGVATPAILRNAPDMFARLAARGAPSVKVYTTYEGFTADDDDLLQIFDGARIHGLTVMVHAENDAAIRRTSHRLLGSGRRAIRYHAVAHSIVAEREAVHRVVSLCEIAGARLVIVHVTCGAAAEEIVRGRARGVQAFGETCPQYLLLTAAHLDTPPAEAIQFVFSPPPRSGVEHARLWQELRDGGLSVFSSDHAPYSLADKWAAGPDPAFNEVANGIPGLETRLPLLFTEGLLSGRLSLARYLDLAGRAAAEIYGLDHCKGRIEVGLDADIVVWAPADVPIRGEALHSAVGYTPFEDYRTAAYPRIVLLRGQPILTDGNVVALPLGRYVARHPAPASAFSIPIEDTTPWLDA